MSVQDSDCPSESGALDTLRAYDPGAAAELETLLEKMSPGLAARRRELEEVLKAPSGKFRVVLVDTFDDADCPGGSPVVKGDYDTLEMAKENAVGGEMLMGYVYDDQGLCRHGSGSF